MIFKIATKVAPTIIAFILAVSSHAKDEATKSELSHAALFAPNTSFPYFETCNKLNTTEGNFDLTTAATLAQFSLLIYVQDQDFISETLAHAGYSKTQFFDSDGTFAFIASNATDIVVTFRGTETGDKRDYRTNSKFVQKKTAGIGTAHTGFIQALEKIESNLESELAKLAENTPRNICITGHSLGAALSTLFGINTKQEIAAIYAVGSPRVGGVKFAEAIEPNFPLYRIVNDNDLVPRFPTEPFYKHIGSTYFITSDGKLVIDPEIMEKWEDHFHGHKKLIKRIWKDHWLKGDFSAIPSDYFVDHSPRLYAEALIKLAGEQNSTAQ